METIMETIMETMYQVNYSSKVDGSSLYWTSKYDKSGYMGVLIDTQYSDGADTTDWCQFVGTKQDCENYIKEQEMKVINPAC